MATKDEPMADQIITTPGAVIPAEALARLIAQLEAPSPLRGSNHTEQVQAHESGRQLGRKQAAESLRALLAEYDALSEVVVAHEQ